MRKAGEKPCGCQHSDPEVFQSIWKHLKTDGVPDQAANQMAAEMVIHGEDFDSSIARYERNYDNFRERGYNEHAAQAMAVEALESGEAPRESTRFANLNPQSESTFTVPEGTSGEDIAAIAEQLTGKKQDNVYLNGHEIY
jgi:hypothetical protein